MSGRPCLAVFPYGDGGVLKKYVRTVWHGRPRLRRLECRSVNSAEEAFFRRYTVLQVKAYTLMICIVIVRFLTDKASVHLDKKRKPIRPCAVFSFRNTKAIPGTTVACLSATITP